MWRFGKPVSWSKLAAADALGRGALRRDVADQRQDPQVGAAGVEDGIGGQGGTQVCRRAAELEFVALDDAVLATRDVALEDGAPSSS